MGRHPTHLNGVRFVAVTLLLLAAAVCAVELFWRSKGHYPVVADTATLWGVHVDRVGRLDADGVVIVGSSRVQLGLDPAVIKKELGASDVVQLARAAASPLPMLEYIADETRFAGTVICGITPGVVYDALQRQRKPVEEGFARRANRPFYAPFEELLLTRAQGALCLNNQSLSWKLAGNGLVRGNWPDPPYAHFMPSRFIRADYSRCREIDILRNDFLRLMNAGRPMNAEQMDVLVDHLDALAGRIRERGGRVLFVRMPSSGQLREVEQRDYPEAVCWNRIKARFGKDAIHFRELEKATGTTYVCPDDSHLDYRDAERFSAALCERI